MLGISAFADETTCPKAQGEKLLATASLFDGPPSERADLMPDSFRKTKAGGWSEWDVAYVFKAGRKLFVACKYGDHAAPIVIQPGPATTKCWFIERNRGRRSLTCVSSAIDKHRLPHR